MRHGTEVRSYIQCSRESCERLRRVRPTQDTPQVDLARRAYACRGVGSRLLCAFAASSKLPEDGRREFARDRYCCMETYRVVVVKVGG